MRIKRIYGILIVFATLLMTAATAEADSARTLDSAVGDLEPGQKMRIQTRDFQMLRGYFVRAAHDSVYLGVSASGKTKTDQATDGDVVCFPEIDRMWVHQPHGIGRGLLWGAGTALVCGALVFALGDSLYIDGMMIAFAVSGAAVIYAVYKGSTGSKEKLVYSSYLQ